MSQCFLYPADLYSVQLLTKLEERRKLDALFAQNTTSIQETGTILQHISSRLTGFEAECRESSASQEELLRRMNTDLGSIRRHLAVGTFELGKGFETYRPKSASIATLYESFKRYNLPIGYLSVQITTRRPIRTIHEPDGAHDIGCEMTFLPPRWVSKVMLRCRFGRPPDRAHSQPGPVLSLTPISINRNTQLSDALYKCDLRQLKCLFEADLARPTDMILCPHVAEPVTLVDVGHPSPYRNTRLLTD